MGQLARLAALRRDQPQLHNAVIIAHQKRDLRPCGLLRTQWRGTFTSPGYAV
jgi:hypothetical protein